MKKIAVFGSLKQGFYNHERFNFGEPIAHGTIKGAMYLYCSSYPHLFRPEVSDPEQVRVHDVEIYEVEEHLYETIRGMELGAGYQEFETTIVDNECVEHEVVIFYTRDDATAYQQNWIEAYDAATVPHACVHNATLV